MNGAESAPFSCLPEVLRGMWSYWVRAAGVMFITLAGTSAHAGIVLSATRVIYPEQDKEATLSVHNNNKSEILLQSWIETAEEGEEGSSFAIVPPLTRVSGGGRQTVRVIHSGAPMPVDRESMFWLNIQEIPQVAEHESALQIGIRQRIKLFYRPRALKSDPVEAPSQLRWNLQEQGKLHVVNPGPYHVTLVNIEVSDRAANATKEKNVMLSPGQAAHFALQGVAKDGAALLKFSSINDHGALVPYQVNLNGWNSGQVAQAIQ